MSAATRRIASCLLFAYAFLWPWDVYQYLPGVREPATGMLCAVLLLLLILDIAAARRLRIPFELLWPAALLAATVFWLSGGAHPFAVSGRLIPVVMYGATVHFSRSRARIEQILALSMAAAAGVSACSIAAAAGILFPTAYSLDWPALAAGPRDLTGGAFTMAAGLAAAVQFAVRPPDSLRRGAWRVFAVCCAAVTATALALLVLGGSGAGLLAAWQPLRVSAPCLPELAAALLLLWLAARTAAKHVVAVRYVRQHNPALSGETAMQGFFVAVVLGATLWCLTFSVHLRSSHGFLLGLAGAYALPDRERLKPLPLRTHFLLPPCLVLVAVNLIHVFPENRADPRNYDVAAQTECDARQFDAVERRMAAIERFAPGERRTHYWRARAELGHGFPHRAAHEFRVSLRPAQDTPLLLPSPNDAERNDFLVRLRDACASAPRPERMLAYEYALVAAGRPQQAVDALRHRNVRKASAPRIRVPAANASAPPTAPLAHTVAFLLGDPDVAPLLDAWSGAELAALLERWGADIDEPPAGLPPDLLPLTFAAWVLSDGVTCRCEAANGAVLERRIPAAIPLTRPSDPATGWDGGGWDPLRADGDAWTTALRIPDGGIAVQVRLSPPNGFTLSEHTLQGGLAPDAPVVRLYVSPSQ